MKPTGTVRREAINKATKVARWTGFIATGVDSLMDPKFKCTWNIYKNGRLQSKAEEYQRNTKFRI